MDPVNNASFLYNGRDAFSGSGTPTRWSLSPVDDCRLDADIVRIRGLGVANVETLGTSKFGTVLKLLL